MIKTAQHTKIKIRKHTYTEIVFNVKSGPLLSFPFWMLAYVRQEEMSTLLQMYCTESILLLKDLDYNFLFTAKNFFYSFTILTGVGRQLNERAPDSVALAWKTT